MDKLPTNNRLTTMKRIFLVALLCCFTQLVEADNFRSSTLNSTTTTYQWYMAEFNSAAPKMIGQGVPLFAPEGVTHLEVHRWALVSYFGEAVKGGDEPTEIVDAHYDNEGRLVSSEVRGSGERIVVKYDEKGLVVRCGLYKVADGSTIKDMTPFFGRVETIGEAMEGHDDSEEMFYFDYSGRGDRCKFVGTGPKQDDYSIDFLLVKSSPTTLTFSPRCLLVSKGNLVMKYGFFGWRKIMKMRGVEKAQKCFTYYCEKPENCDMTTPNASRTMTLNEAGIASVRSAQSCFEEGWQNDDFFIEYRLR